MTRVTTAGNSLVLTSDPLPPGIVQALPLSLLWGQGVVQAKGDKIGTDAYFTDLGAALGGIAWIVTDAGTTSYTVSGDSVRPGDAILALAKAMVPADQLADLTRLFAAIDKAGSNDALGNFLTTWWNNRKASAQGTVFAAVPAGINNNLQLEATLVQLDFTLSVDGWQSFFLSRMSNGAGIVARHIRLTLNADLWSTLQDSITAKLGRSAVASVQSLDL